MQQGCDIEPRYATASSGHSNGEDYPHRRRTRRIVQSYSPGGADMHVHLIQCPWVHARAPVQTASRSVHPFLHILSFYPDPLLLGLQCSSVDSGQSAKCPFPCWICTGFQLGGGVKIGAWFIGPTRVCIINRLTCGSTVLNSSAQHRQTTERATPTSVAVGRIYAMMLCTAGRRNSSYLHNWWRLEFLTRNAML